MAPSHYAQCPFSSAFQRPLDRVGFSPVATEMDHRTLGSKGNFLFLFLADLPTLTSPDDGDLIGEISSERRVMLKFCIFQEQQSIPRSAALHAISVPARRQHLHFYSGREPASQPKIIPCRVEIMPAIFPDTSGIILKSFYIPRMLPVQGLWRNHQ